MLLTVAIAFFVYPRLPQTAAVGSFFGHYTPMWLRGLAAGEEKRIAEVFLLIFCFATPLWIVPLSTIAFAGRRYMTHEQKTASDVQTSYEFSKPTHSHPVFLVPLSRQAYELLDRKRYIWALCYFGLFGFLALHLLVIATFASLAGLKYLMSLYKEIGYLPSFMLVPFVAIPVIFAEKLIVRPYSEILRCARKIPTKEMHLVDCENIRFAVALLIVQLADLVQLNDYLAEFGRDTSPATEERKASIEHEREKRLVEISETTHHLIAGWSNLKEVWRIQEFDLHEAPPDLQTAFFAQRSEIILQTVELDKLEDLLLRANIEPSHSLHITRFICELRAQLACSLERKAD